MLRFFLWFFGAFSLILGIIGIFLPILPTTPFILLTAFCWAKASPRFYMWLINHKQFGPIIKRWEKNHAIPKKAKLLSSMMMAISVLIVFWRYSHQLWIGVIVGIICVSVSIWIWKCPDR